MGFPGIPGFPGWPYGDPNLPWPIGDGGGMPLPAATDESKAQLLETSIGAGLALAYGRHLVGGTPFLSDYDEDAQLTKLFIALGEGRWNAIEKLWIDSVLKDHTDTGLVHFHPGMDGESGTEANPAVANQKICSLFPAALTGTTFSRTPYIALAIPDDPASPGPGYAIQGIYQTRLVRLFDATGAETSFEYSANPAWCLLDAFITLALKPHGAVDEALTAGEQARIDFSAFVDAAAYCDADIGGGIKRFESHVFFKEETNLQKIMETLCATCRGYLREHEGQLALYVDQPRASVFTFDTDKIVNLTFETSAADLRSTANRLVVKIRDLESGGGDAAKDFAPFTKTLDAEWHQEQVGRIIKKEMDLGANTKERTERVGTYWLNRALLEKNAQLTATLDAGAIMPGDRVTGFINQEMVDTGDWEVIEVTDEPDGAQRQVSLQEYDAAIFSDAAGTQQDAEETVISPVRKPRTVAHSSYRPLSNPLTATDAGASATVDIAAFTMRVAGVDIDLDSGAIVALDYNTLYYIFYDDVGMQGGAVSYYATTVKETALASMAAFFVGSIQTPRATAPDTQGNNDGGAGAQAGMLNTLNLSVTDSTGTIGTGVVTDPINAIDADLTTKATIEAAAGGGGGQAFIYLSGPPAVTRKYSSATLYLRCRCLTNDVLPDGEGTFGSYYSLDSGAWWTSFGTTVVSPDTLPVTIFSVPLPAGQNLALVMVYAFIIVTADAVSGSTVADIFEAWIEAVE